MKKVITHPQKSDMGSGFGIIEFEPGTNLDQILGFYRKNSKTWGTCTIQYADGRILRKFDYNLYHSDLFYYKLSWELAFEVKEVKLEYCFMCEDITIILNR